MADLHRRAKLLDGNNIETADLVPDSALREISPRGFFQLPLLPGCDGVFGRPVLVAGAHLHFAEDKDLPLFGDDVHLSTGEPVVGLQNPQTAVPKVAARYLLPHLSDISCIPVPQTGHGQTGVGGAAFTLNDRR
jgi:hypothetical protein